MNTKNKKKLCWNCEGSVDVGAERCPFCGVSTDVTPIPGTQPKKAQPAPPKKAPAPPYQLKEESAEETKESNPFQAATLAISTLLLGTVLTIFSLVLALFSNSKGIFTLSWSGEWWYIYLIIALPLLWLGWRTASRLNVEAD